MSLTSDSFAKSFPLKKLKIGEIYVSYEEVSQNHSKEFLELLHEAQLNPKSAYGKAHLLKEETPQFDNLLAYLYLQNKEKEKAEDLILKSYEKYPNYFFAKINYADQCLRFKKLQKIQEIFPSFQLNELFPEKKDFHVSEFRGFMILLSRYFLSLKNKEKAFLYYQNAYLADPSHPSVIALEKEIFSKNIWFKSLNLFLKFLKLCPIFSLRKNRTCV